MPSMRTFSIWTVAAGELNTSPSDMAPPEASARRPSMCTTPVAPLTSRIRLAGLFDVSTAPVDR